MASLPFFLIVRQILVTSKRSAFQAELSCFQLVQNNGCRKKNIKTPLGFPPLKQLGPRLPPCLPTIVLSSWLR